MIGTSIIHFKEEQRLRDWWLWLILALAALVSIGASLLTLSSPAGHKTEVFIALSVAVPIQVLIMVLLFISKFEIKVNDSGVHYKWYPFHFKYKTIRNDDIENFYVREVPALKRGINFVWGYGWAYNASGGKGVQFELKNKKKVFLGSQKVNALRTAIEQLMHLKKQIQ